MTRLKGGIFYHLSPPINAFTNHNLSNNFLQEPPWMVLLLRRSVSPGRTVPFPRQGLLAPPDGLLTPPLDRPSFPAS
jgi:hypothetical protein